MSEPLDHTIGDAGVGDEEVAGVNGEVTDNVQAADSVPAAEAEAETNADAAPTTTETTAMDIANLSDDESVLSDIDESQFQGFDPANVELDERPALAIDEENLKMVGRHKRARREGEEDGAQRRKKKEGRREKKKRRRPQSEVGNEEYEVADGGKPRRRNRAGRSAEQEVDEEALDPTERRRRELDRMMDAALKKPTKSRVSRVATDEVDLTNSASMAEQGIEDMRRRMTEAARLDSEARKEGKPAMHKLKMLPEVVSLLNRNQLVSSLVDPEINLLEAVKFFLEPLDDGSLPAYNIQRDLFEVLGKLPINKDTLTASGVGKVVLFYTKSKRPEMSIKRKAERLLADWSRPILQRSDDFSKKTFHESVTPGFIAQQIQTASDRRASADPYSGAAYTVVSRPTVLQEGKFARPLGSSGEDRYKRMRARQIAARGGPSRR